MTSVGAAGDTVRTSFAPPHCGAMFKSLESDAVNDACHVYVPAVHPPAGRNAGVDVAVPVPGLPGVRTTITGPKIGVPLQTDPLNSENVTLPASDVEPPLTVAVSVTV